MATKTLLTIEQFDQLPIIEGTLYKLNEGEVVTITAPMPRHNWARDNIARLMGNFVEERKLGRVFVETGYQLSAETVRIPDVSFVPADRMREIDLDSRIQGALALAIEVVSPTDLAEGLTQKVKQYLAAGASFVRHEHETLEDHDLLPGFALDLRLVFGVNFGLSN